MKKKLKVEEETEGWMGTWCMHDKGRFTELSIPKRSILLRGIYLEEGDYVEITLRKCKK